MADYSYGRVKSLENSSRRCAFARRTTLTRTTARIAVIASVIVVGSGAHALAVGNLGSLEPGSPRRWEADIDVSTYSSVNTHSGNLFTAIPIVSWSGKGPDMNFALFHNSANWAQTPEDSKNLGFFLGAGWSMSYSDHILPENPHVVIHADGTRDTFTWNGTSWVAPTGVYDQLTQDAIDPDIWTLKHRDQSFHEFQGGWPDTTILRLTRIVDAVGNETTIEYESFLFNSNVRVRIKSVTAAGRQLQFEYQTLAVEPGTKLYRIKDPGEQNQPVQGISIADRYWTPEYTTDPDGRTWMTKLADPMGNKHDFSYELDVCTPSPCASTDFVGRLAAVSDKYKPGDATYGSAHNYTHTYVTATYGQHKAKRTTDPTGGLYQEFSYTADNNHVATTSYFDRRANEWKHVYNVVGDGTLNEVVDPALVSNRFYYDVDLNLAEIGDGDWFWWLRWYDSNGNLVRAEDPYTTPRLWTYSATNNNVESYTDADGHTTRYCYEKSGFPILLTKIIHPDSAMTPSSPASCSSTGYPTTTMDYYTTGAGKGQLLEVIDPNGVWTGFEYDLWGQQARYTEGRYDTQTAASVNVVDFHMNNDGGGNTQSSDGPGGGGDASYDANGNPTGSSCVIPAAATASVTDMFVPQGHPKLPCAGPELPRLCAEFSGATYTPKGQLVSLALAIDPEGCGGVISHTRTSTAVFDALNRQTNATTVSNESGTNITRSFGHAYNWGAGTYTRIGPDGVETFIQYDAANRISTLRRGPSSSPIMTATYAYSATRGTLTSITYGNGAVKSFTYDNAQRVTQIKYVHGGTTRFQQDYRYSGDDLPTQVLESGILAGGSSEVLYTYDARRRLTREVRTGGSPYDYTYEYDKGGNRTKKIDARLNRRTDYFYDLASRPTQHGVSITSDTYKSNNNRLVYSKFYNTTSGANTLLSTTFYYYTRDDDGLAVDIGNATYIVTHTAGTTNYTATRFGYGANDQIVTFALGESWSWDGNAANCPTNYDITWAREFRYDGARARYLVRQLDDEDLELGDIVALSEMWTDYDGDDVYGDFTLSGSTATHTVSYEQGVATVDPAGTSGSGDSRYTANDRLGTVRGLIDTTGFPVVPAVYTAFGERRSGENHRFGFVGAFGYQTHNIDEAANPITAFPFQHVGARYYDPASGRFLQRDPIGIEGGSNVYSYVGGLPTLFIDPEGLKKVKTPHGWKNTKTGRFTKAPLWRRAVKKIPPYAAGCVVARAGHKVAGRPYEDPHDVIIDTAENIYDYLKNKWDDRQKRKDNPGVFEKGG